MGHSPNPHNGRRALEKVQPEWIEASDIDVKIGTTWIEPLDYEQFIYELLNTPRRARAVRSQFYNTGIQVHLLCLYGSTKLTLLKINMESY